MKRRNRRLAWALGGMVVLQMLLYLAFTYSDPPPAIPPAQDIDVTGGVPAQRQRIDRFIAQTDRSSSIDDLSQALHERVEGDFDIVFDAGAPAAGPTVIFPRVLADRRAARLYELLSELKPEDAAGQVKKMFNAKLAQHMEAWDTVIGMWKEDNPPETPFPLQANFHALTCITFLAGRFCDIDTVEAMIHIWTVEAQKRRKEITAAELHLLSYEFSEEGVPDALFFSNIYICYLQKAGRLDHAHISKRLKESGSYVRFTTIPYVSWDAHTNSFDFTHQNRGVPVDESRVLIPRFQYLHTWADGAMHVQAIAESNLKIFREIALSKPRS